MLHMHQFVNYVVYVVAYYTLANTDWPCCPFVYAHLTVLKHNCVCNEVINNEVFSRLATNLPLL